MNMPRVITPTQIRDLLGNLSRQNYYQMTFSLPLISGLGAYLSARGVDPSFIRQDIGLLCNAATLPGSNLATTESYNYVGLKENFAHTLMYDTLKLEFYVDNTYKTLKFFEHWIGFITSGQDQGLDYGSSTYFRELRYPEEYKTSGCKVYKFENDNRSIDSETLNINRFMEYSFIGLYPVDLFETPLQYTDESGIMNVSVAFNYDRHIAGSINSIDYLAGNNNNLQGILKTVSNLNLGDISSFINI